MRKPRGWRLKQNPVRGMGMKLSTIAFIIAGIFVVKAITSAAKAAEAAVRPKETP